MAWSFGTVTTNDTVTNPNTVAISIAGTGNEVFVAVLGCDDGRDYTLNTATFNSQNMTRVATAKSADDEAIDMVYYDCSALPAGSYNFHYQVTTGGPDAGSMAWFVLTGARASSVENTKNSSTGTGAPSTSVTPTEPQCMVINAIYHGTSTLLTEAAGQTRLWGFSPSGYGNVFMGGYKLVSSAGATTMSYTGGGTSKYAQVVVVFNPEEFGGSFIFNLI